MPQKSIINATVYGTMKTVQNYTSHKLSLDHIMLSCARIILCWAVLNRKTEKHIIIHNILSTININNTFKHSTHIFCNINWKHIIIILYHARHENYTSHILSLDHIMLSCALSQNWRTQHNKTRHIMYNRHKQNIQT